MKTILICAQKGGVGKSMIADELAFSFERTGTPMSFFDLDGQGGTIHKKNSLPNADVAIVDTPGALHPDLGKWIANADLVIVPTRASTRDIPPFTRIVELVGKNQRKDSSSLVVVNAINRFTACRDFGEWLKQFVTLEDIAMLPQAEIFIHAAALGKSVVELNRKHTASHCVLDLCNRVRQLLGVPLEPQEISLKRLLDETPVHAQKVVA